ncbi:hypothetical protein RZS08_19140, partial [Arthrospira platensis SPKY1]|nr:hypothetical protein [Arthrospira platensis SPKY1]
YEARLVQQNIVAEQRPHDHQWLHHYLDFSHKYSTGGGFSCGQRHIQDFIEQAIDFARLPGVDLAHREGLGLQDQVIPRRHRLIQQQQADFQTLAVALHHRASLVARNHQGRNRDAHRLSFKF